MTTEERARVAEWCDVDKPPSREYAMAKVVWRKVSHTGPEFGLDDGRKFKVPPGGTLRQPEGSDDWNDRYALFIAHQLGDEINAEVDAYRLPAKEYGKSLDLCREFEAVVEKRGLMDIYITFLKAGVLMEAGRATHQTYDRGLVMATPEQRCAAILKVIDAGKGE